MGKNSPRDNEADRLAERLRELERKYGGPMRVPRVKVSPNDPRTPEQLKKGTMAGGERMVTEGNAHNYAPFYAKSLKHFVGERTTLVEVGILAGTGLAMWCDLFPDGKVFGLDIDLGHYRNHKGNLEMLGAFERLEPFVAEFDQLVSPEEQRKVLDGIFCEGEINIVVDDGFHSDESILGTFEALQPYLSGKHVYFIEDNKKVFPKLVNGFKGWSFKLHITGPRWTDALIVGRRK